MSIGPNKGEQARNISLNVSVAVERSGDDKQPDQSSAPPALHREGDGNGEHQGDYDGLIGEIGQVSHAAPIGDPGAGKFHIRVITCEQ